MGREITRRHFFFFEKKLKNPFSFVRDIYQYQKGSELFSFLVWEICHRLGLFRNYVKLENPDVLALTNERLHDEGLRQRINTFFQTRGLHLTPLEPKWKLLFIRKPGEVVGCVYPDDHELYQSVDGGKSITLLHRFPESIKSIYVSSQNTLFVCVKGAVYRRSADDGEFIKVLNLGSHESFFRHNNEITEMPNRTLVVGEYGNIWDDTHWRKLAYLYFSGDDGETWDRSDFLIDKGINKHVHLVKYSPRLKQLFMADGDNKKKLWTTFATTVAALKRPENWNPVTKVHIQMGGYTSVVETDEKLLFGTDYQGGTNFLVESRDGKHYRKTVIPDPYRRSPIDNMVLRQSARGTEIWANLPYSTAKTQCLLMYSADGGESWSKVFDYHSGKYRVWLISATRELSDELYLSIEDRTRNERIVYRVTE